MNTFEYVALVILIYGSLASALVYFAIKKTRLLMIVLGVAAILGAVPLGFLSEAGINGCCGASHMGRGGAGYLLGVLVGIAGIVLVIFGYKFKKKKPSK